MANVALLLDMAADAMGDRVAVGTRAEGLTYSRLRSLARSAGSEIKDHEARAVAFSGANSRAVPLALFASAWAGASYAPVNYRLPPAQVAQLIERLATDYVVSDGEKWLRGFEADGAQDYPYEPDQPALLLFTSGSSAAPKVAVLTHDNLLAYILAAGELASAEEDEAVLLVAPPFHIAGVAGVLSSIYAGRRIVPLDQFSPERWIGLARAEGVTHGFLVPTMLARIVAHLDATGANGVETLRSISYGGARMPAPVLERALALFPNAGFVNAYGLTETSSTVTLLSPSDHREALASDDPAIRARLSSVGKPLPGVEVLIATDSGEPLAAGEEGRIQIRGAQVSGTYVDGDGSTDESGWLVTGDLGRIDDAGYIFVNGRADDVIIVGGENVSPGEVEDCLLRHPAVSGAAVVGIADEEWGEDVAAMVTTIADVSADELSGWVRTELGGLKAPKRIEFCDELPMTATSKVLRREVREKLQARTSAGS